VTAEGDDPLVMYFVVRKDARLTLGQAMARAGAAATVCGERFAASGDALAAAWRTWWPRQRKVALRAAADELERVRELHPCVGDETLLCLPPLRRSERSELLAGLRPFTDAKAPAEPPEAAADDVPALVYVIRPGVMKTAGKAMAQAGHAALLCVDAEPAERIAPWRAAGRPGEVLLAGPGDDWQALAAVAGAAVVADGGLTQVEPGTETVIGLPPAPRSERPPLVRALDRLP
jgi:peptidyl-tRNA hydrolase